MTFYNKVNTTGTPSSGQILVATDAHDAAWQANNSTTGTWVTSVDVDFTAQTTVNPVTDGSYSFTNLAGSNITFHALNSNTPGGNPASFIVQGAGWHTRPTNSGLGNNATYGAHNLTLFRVLLTDLYANITPNTPIRMWLYVTGETQYPQQNGGSGEDQVISVDDWNGSAYTYDLYGYRGAGGSNFSFFAGVNNPTGTSGTSGGGPIFFTAPAIFMVHMPDGIAGRRVFVHRDPIISLSGTFNVTNGSVQVPTTVSQVGVLGPGSQVVFGAQNSNGAQLYIVAAVSSTSITLANSYSGTSNAATTGFANNSVTNLSGTFSVTNTSTTVTASTSQTGALNPGDQIIFNSHSLGLSGTFNVSNGSSSVTATNSQTGTIGPGEQITFADQVGVYYTIATVSGTAITLTTNYTGTGNPATTGSYLLPYPGTGLNTPYQFTVESVSGTNITLSPITPYGGTTISGVTAVSVSKAANWPAATSLVPAAYEDIGNTSLSASAYTSYTNIGNQYMMIGVPGVPGTGGFNGYVCTIARFRMDYVQGQ